MVPASGHRRRAIATASVLVDLMMAPADRGDIPGGDILDWAEAFRATRRMKLPPRMSDGRSRLCGSGTGSVQAHLFGESSLRRALSQLPFGVRGAEAIIWICHWSRISLPMSPLNRLFPNSKFRFDFRNASGIRNSGSLEDKVNACPVRSNVVIPAGRAFFSTGRRFS